VEQELTNIFVTKICLLGYASVLLVNVFPVSQRICCPHLPAGSVSYYSDTRSGGPVPLLSIVDSCPQLIAVVSYINFVFTLFCMKI
jgi:hypothetical protein